MAGLNEEAEDAVRLEAADASFREIDDADETLAPWDHETEEIEDEEEEEERPTRSSRVSRGSGRSSGNNRRGTTRRERPSVRKDSAHVKLPWNDCILEGNLGRDPDVKFTANGEIWLVKFSLAVYNGKYSKAEIDRGQDQSGNEIPRKARVGDKRRPIWISCQATWDAANDFTDDEAGFQQGSAVKLYGRLDQHEYDGKVYTDFVFDDYEEVVFDDGSERRNGNGRSTNNRQARRR